MGGARGLGVGGLGAASRLGAVRGLGARRLGIRLLLGAVVAWSLVAAVAMLGQIAGRARVTSRRMRGVWASRRDHARSCAP